MKNIRKRSKKKSPPFEEVSGIRDLNITKISYGDDSELDFFRKRALISSVILIFFFSVVITRLWYLQIQKGPQFKDLADNNRVRYVEITAPRGNIYDKKDRPIVSNRPSFNVVWVREDNRLNDELLKKMAELLNEDISVLVGRIRKMVDTPGHIPIRLAEDLDWKTLAYIENNRMDLPGIKIEVVPLRTYHFSDLASHVIGYLGEINERELKQAGDEIYRGGDLIGKMGLEKLREKELRGEKGRDYTEVNALGFEQKNLKGIEPLPGNDLRLTIDMDLQRIAEDAMNGADKAGAVVVVEVNTGRLLTLASVPGLPLKEFVGGISQKTWSALLENPHKPLRNKIVQEHYPPGSTYKMITALAGLAENLITPQSVVFCPGDYKLGNRTFRCWKRGGHGSVALDRALAESCDVYFYSLGQRLGVDRLASYAHKFGLGTETGVEMEHESAGLVPTTAWKRRAYNEKWHEGETLSVAIGQGANLTTPLQICMMTATLANGGTLYRPSLMEEVRDSDNNIIERFEPAIVQRFTGQAEHFRLIRDGMIKAVNNPSGTGRIAKFEDMIVAGKTGTAQVVRVKQYRHLREEDIPYKYRDHAWFTCFAPAQNPQIAVTVLVEHGLHGGSGAAPVARAVLEKYFEDRLQKDKDGSQVTVMDGPEE